MRKPESMEECVYFTKRSIGNGKVMAWVFRKDCVDCNGGVMEKPKSKSGKPDKKAQIYVCSKCGSKKSNEEVEKDLIVNVEYTCPHCLNEGEAATEYKKRNYKGVQAYVFECEKCREKISITKKLKGV